MVQQRLSTLSRLLLLLSSSWSTLLARVLRLLVWQSWSCTFPPTLGEFFSRLARLRVAAQDIVLTISQTSFSSGGEVLTPEVSPVNLATSSKVVGSTSIAWANGGAKAADGSVDSEWISNQKAGAWIKMTWSSAVTFNQVVLYVFFLFRSAYDRASSLIPTSLFFTGTTETARPIALPELFSLLPMEQLTPLELSSPMEALRPSTYLPK